MEFGRHIGLKIRSFFKREGSSPSSPMLSDSNIKENNMSTVKQIRNEMYQQIHSLKTNANESNAQLLSRMNVLMDDIHSLKREMNTFKRKVAEDIKTLEEMHDNEPKR